MGSKKKQKQNKRRQTTGGMADQQKKLSTKKDDKKQSAQDDEEIDYGATADAFFGVDADNSENEEMPAIHDSDDDEAQGNDDDDDDDDMKVEEDASIDDDDDAKNAKVDSQKKKKSKIKGVKSNQKKKAENDEDEEDDSGSDEYYDANEKQDADDDSNDDNDDEDDNKNDNEDDRKEESESEEDDDEEDEEEEEEQTPTQSPKVIPIVGTGDEPCSFDLRNLTAVNAHPLQESSLYKKKKKKQDDKLTIPTTTTTPINEDYVLQKATDGCTQLIAALWQLPTERSDAGPLVVLPSYDTLSIPRALPPPPPKAPTKWEQFAKERGIPLNKEKRSAKVWDETTGEWKFRHGYQKANVATDTNSWPIMEVGDNQDPYADPWEAQRDAKYQRTEANRQNQLKNQERAGNLPKGFTRRTLKAREQARQAGKAGGRLDHALPTGVPVDMTGNKLRGKSSTMAALKATQVSTASLGRFDKMREGEPERKLDAGAANKKKKRKFLAEHPTSGRSGAGEQERTSRVLAQVLNGGGVEKEKARKKGKLAKGVTAYDYEYDDGTDNALFRKKKGRGGVGKNKKMTKKRIK